MKSNTRKNKIIINLLAAFIWMSVYVYTPVLPAYAQTMGATATLIGMISGAYGVMQIILRVPVGLLSDRWGKDKLLLLIGYIIAAISSLIFVLGDQVWLLILGRGVSGISAAWWVAICAIYAKYHSSDQQVRAQGILTFSSSGGKVIGALLSGIIAQQLGYPYIFYASLLLSIGGIALVLSMDDTRFPIPKKQADSPRLSSLFRNRTLMVFAVLGIISHTVGFSIPTVFASVAAGEVGASSFQIGLLVVVYCLAMSLSGLFVGTRPYQRMGGIHALGTAFGLSAISCLPALYSHSVGLIFVAQAISGISYGIILGALSGMVIMSVPEQQRGQATGLFHAMSGIGIFIGPVIVGRVTDLLSMDGAFYIMLASNLLAVLLIYLFVPKKFATYT